MATHFTKRKTTRIIYFLLEVYNTIYKVFLPKIESLNAIKPLDLAINLQEIQQIEENINRHHGDALSKMQTVGSIKGQNKTKKTETKTKSHSKSEKDKVSVGG